MGKRTSRNVRLGIFVLGGLTFLVLLLYMIGKNRDLFGNTYVLKARFNNAKGLVEGNNVRYAGIDVGTVRNVDFLSDTVIEVTMIIQEKMKKIIRKNSICWISTEGIVGNKVVHIEASGEPSELAREGDLLLTQKGVDTDYMMEVLSETNIEVAGLVQDLKATVERINNSTALWSLLNDEAIPKDLKASLAHIRRAAGNANNVVSEMDVIVSDVQSGKGTIGALLTDTTLMAEIKNAVEGIRQIERNADSLSVTLQDLASEISHEVVHGEGPVNTLLYDTAIVNTLNSTLQHLETGTRSFNENMEALKHNFLFRGYFRKQEKMRQKELSETRN